ncbi:probable serine/threonine-protein kinase PBL6 isoform X2 [Lactuca sativa]|uniref:probable serine/threonine-protein kinase PBL6 isoform X2 n=1 Tax=Lactuca sativa TaxID=4236 RepID=UPI001C692254|nr:probable serine/threonine-protein kinase PBL6 isoform X2 [Lactuca sativa]
MDYKRREFAAALNLVGNFGTEHVMADVEVASFLGDILPISRAANEVEQSSPRVAYLCRLHALEKVGKLDPRSSDRGVHQFKIDLIHQLNEQFLATLGVQRNSDAQEMHAFYRHYCGNYIQGLQNTDEVDSIHLEKAYKTAAVLFEVLKAVSWQESVAVMNEIFKIHEEMSTRKILQLQPKYSDQALPRHPEIEEEAEMYTDDIFSFHTESSVQPSVRHSEILKAHTEVAEKAEMYTHNNILPIEPENEDQAILRHPEQNHLRIPLQVIKSCTQDFNERNSIGRGGYGKVYMGILTWGDHVNQLVAVKRQNIKGGQGKKEFHTEVTMLSAYQHKNIITLIGFCDEDEEMILVYEYASHGSLDTYIHKSAVQGGLPLPQLLKTCIGVASALNYLHNHVAEKHRIIHRDIKCANILLDENWNAKLADFGLARIGLANQENTFVITNLAGTHGYCDPEYEKTGFLTKESDVYSFGVVLFEVLCGRLACAYNYHDERRFLHHLARTRYKNGELEKIIDPNIRKVIKPRTLLIFSAIAYRCLQETREARPTIAEVESQLKDAMKAQLEDSNSQMNG